MISPVAKVALGHLAEFLERHGPEWDIDAFPAFEENLGHRPVTVEELVTAIECYTLDSDFVYVFSDEMSPYDAANTVDFHDLPEVDNNALEQYIIRNVMGRDFLYFAPSFEDAANGTYVTLLPVEEEEHQEPSSLEPEPTFLISAISIENFKGIGERQTIELKPITLLFGPNSGGKSTVLHAIHYAREVLVRRNLDADRTETGGAFVDLGGFACFVHKHDRRSRVGLRFDLNLADAVLPGYAVGQEGLARLGWQRKEGDEASSERSMPGLDETPDFSARVKTAWVELTVAWSHQREACFVESYGVGINGEPLATIRCDFNRREVGVVDLNTRHPIFGPRFEPGLFCRSEEDTVADHLVRLALGYESSDQRLIYLEGLDDALPTWGKCLSLDLDLIRSNLDDLTASSAIPSYWELVQLVSGFSQLIVGPGELLRNELARFRYLGPLRATPARDHRPPRFPEPSRWANGLAAWDLLHQKSGWFVEAISDWLSLTARLDAGYRVDLSTFREVEIASRLGGILMSFLDFDSIEDLKGEFDKIPVSRRVILIDEQAGVEVQPHDVGMGISQLIPVVALAIEDRVDLATIEQPELHIHPRVQTGLGDLFISAITARPAARYLIETHSEHLLLRLIRRIRETGEGELQVHPEEARAGLEKRGHADSTWSCVNLLQTGRSACPPACCTMPSASAAMTTSGPSTSAVR